MSYELFLFKPDVGRDPLDTAEQLLAQQEESDELNPGDPRPELEHQKQMLVVTLKQLWPELEVYRFWFEEIAAQEGISESEARRRYRHLELNGPTDRSGIQITLFDTTVSISIPFWTTGEQAVATIRELWELLALFERVVGYAAYDLQLDKVLDLNTDFSGVLECYGDGAQQVQQFLGDGP